MPAAALNRIRSGIAHISFRSYSTGKYVGFIGLGNMGQHMARNLVKKGHSLVVYDIQSAATGAIEKLGAKVVSTPAEVASMSEKVVTMLPTSMHCRSVYAGVDGILQGAKPGTLFLDSSTIDPDTSKDLANLAKQNNTFYLDCPVSGGTGAANSGTLTFMVGGPSKQFKEIESILLDMGSKVVHCGAVGHGQVAKICNNMLLGICMVGTSEAMNLGIKMGLDAKLLAGIINSSSGRNWSSEIYNPVPGVIDTVPASNEYKGGFGTALMTKDLGLAQSAASSAGTPTPLGAMSYQMYRMLCSKGLGNKDFSVIYQFLQEETDGNTNNH